MKPTPDVPESGQGFIVEYMRLPGAGGVKVTAVDPESGTEVSIVGPVAAGREGLAKLAIRKLRYIMRKK